MLIYSKLHSRSCDYKVYSTQLNYHSIMYFSPNQHSSKLYKRQMIFALSVNKNQRRSIFFQFGIINWADNVNWPFRALALRHLLWRRANARNVSFETLNSGQFTLSTQLIIPNYVAIVSYWRSTKLSLPPSFKYLSGDPSPFHQGNLNSKYSLIGFPKPSSLDIDIITQSAALKLLKRNHDNL